MDSGDRQVGTSSHFTACAQLKAPPAKHRTTTASIAGMQ